MTQPIIRFEGVSKAFGTQTVLRDFSLDVEPGAFVSIIGRSGCGKTTVLKLVNGLLSPDTGRVLIQGQDVARIDPVALRRRIGYAIQNVGLFPHMTVEKNIAYVTAISGLKEWKGKQCREKVAALLKQVGLDPALAGRYPRALSGGQRQRVASALAMPTRWRCPLRRAAPAGGHRQGAGRRSGASADGRAFRRGGRDHPGPAAG